MPNLITPADRSHLFTTAARWSQLLRAAADDHFHDADKWCVLTDAADEYAAMPPHTPVPLF